MAVASGSLHVKQYKPYFSPEEVEKLSAKQRGKLSVSREERARQQACGFLDAVGVRCGLYVLRLSDNPHTADLQSEEDNSNRADAVHALPPVLPVPRLQLPRKPDTYAMPGWELMARK